MEGPKGWQQRQRIRWKTIGTWLLGIGALIFGGRGLLLAIFKLVILLKYGLHVDLRTVAISRQGLSLFDLFLEEPQGSVIRVEEIVIDWKNRVCHVRHPRLVLSLASLEHLPSWLEEPTSMAKDWTGSLTKGWVEGEGLRPFQVTLFKEPGRDYNMYLAWEEKGTAHVVTDFKTKGSCTFQHVEFDSFAKWTAMGSLQGEGSGEFGLALDEQGTWQASFHIDGVGISYLDWVEGLVGSLDWQGPVLSLDAEGSRWQCELQEGRIHTLDQVKGKGYWVAGMGSRWNLSGVYETTQCSLSGRACLQRGLPKWVDSQVTMQEGTIHLQGRQPDSVWEWTGDLAIGSKCAWELVRSWGVLFEKRLSLFDWEEGSLQAKWRMEGVLWDKRAKHWVDLDLSQVRAKGWQGHRFSVGSAHLTLQYPSCEGELQGKGMTVEAYPMVWDVEVKVDPDKRISLEALGSLEQQQLCLTAQGVLEHLLWHGQMGGDVINGSFDLDSFWRNDRLEVVCPSAYVQGIELAGKGWWSPSFEWAGAISWFQGPCQSLVPWIDQKFALAPEIEGIFESRGHGLLLRKEGGDILWHLEAALSHVKCPINDSIMCQDLSCEIDWSPGAFHSYGMHGTVVGGLEMDLFAPYIDWEHSFDVRITHPLFDWIRLVGLREGDRWRLDPLQSHCLGGAMDSGEGSLQAPYPFSLRGSVFNAWCQEGLRKLFPELVVDAKEGSCLFEIRQSQMGALNIDVQGSLIDVKTKQVSDIVLSIEEKEGLFHVSRGKLGLWQAQGVLTVGLQGLAYQHGLITHPTLGQGHIEGDLTWKGSAKGHISEFQVELAPLLTLSDRKGDLQGRVEGSFDWRWDGQWEAQGSFFCPLLVQGAYQIRPHTAIDWRFRGDEGWVTGPLETEIEGPHTLSVRAEALRYQEAWALDRAEMMMTLYPPDLPFEGPIHLVGDLVFDREGQWTSQIQHALCHYKGTSYQLRSGIFQGQGKTLQAKSDLLVQDLWVSVIANVHLEERPYGKLSILDPRIEELEETFDSVPLTLRWSLSSERDLLLHTIEGHFGGCEAIFHEEAPGCLIGSMRIHCETLYPFVPVTIQELFSELRMGQGYELKGHLFWSPDHMGFEGLLSGEEFAFFGFQLQSMTSHISIGPRHVHLTDLKMSDFAGRLVIDEIAVMEEVLNEPWVLRIPHLTIQELRPSQLRRVGQMKTGPLTPLVVRELSLVDVRGMARFPETYRAEGALTFINSYKREATIFDAPSDVLSRIAGLDLDILIPVKGRVVFALEEGSFHLKDLIQSFSEGDRSTFFLEGNPKVGLDGTIDVLIRMKQFVLFKFTESFFISIEGKLDHPKFKLKRKKGFVPLD
jgi:hypothetical protein